MAKYNVDREDARKIAEGAIAAVTGADENGPKATPRQAVNDKAMRGSYDTSDIDARMEAIKNSRYGLSLQDIKDAEDMKGARMDRALTARKNTQNYELDTRKADTADAYRSALTDASRQNTEYKTLNDVDALRYKHAMGVLADPLLRDQHEGMNQYLDAMDSKIEKTKALSELRRRQGITPYAEGGEVEAMLGGMGAPEMPEAIPTEPMQMDSGDYIIPVEAMRFYGRKFFQDLINKAEDTE